MKKSPLAKTSKSKIPKLKRKLQPMVNANVRARDGRCVAVGAGGFNCGGGLQASHILPEGAYQSIRFDPDNILTMCYKHHIFWWHKNPVEASIWLENYLTKKQYDYVMKTLKKKYISWDAQALEKEIKKYKELNASL